MVALRACGEELSDLASSHLVGRLQQSGQWTTYQRPTFAVDGSKFAVPRTKQNLKAFAASSRKSKAAYKNTADYQKAKTTRLHITLCMHLATGFPVFWGLGGSSDSERGLLLNLLDRLPEGSRLIMDAYYTGYEFWKRLIDDGFTFVVRAGSNVELLSGLKEFGTVNSPL